MKVLALPRDPNPYQGLLYGALSRHGVQSAYAADATPSRTLNHLLLPLELVARRARGWRTLHLHWVFTFIFPGAGRWALLRRLARCWFALVLAVARALGMRVVWTAHNTLPHDRVFDDDAAARRTLVRRSDLVIAHSQATLDELADLGARPHHAAVLPVGPLAHAAAVPVPPAGPRRELLFFGKVLPYKGVEELLEAAGGLESDAPIRVTVAGECPDPALAQRLRDQAAALPPGRVSLQLSFVPERDIAPLMAAADVVALPFRAVSTSSSLMLALEHRRPVLIPDLPALRQVPAECCLRYDGTVDGLGAALRRAAALDAGRLAAMSAAAGESGLVEDWPSIARRTLDALREVPA